MGFRVRAAVRILVKLALFCLSMLVLLLYLNWNTSAGRRSVQADITQLYPGTAADASAHPGRIYIEAKPGVQYTASYEKGALVLDISQNIAAWDSIKLHCCFAGLQYQNTDAETYLYSTLSETERQTYAQTYTGAYGVQFYWELTGGQAQKITLNGQQKKLPRTSAFRVLHSEETKVNGTTAVSTLILGSTAGETGQEAETAFGGGTGELKLTGCWLRYVGLAANTQDDTIKDSYSLGEKWKSFRLQVKSMLTGLKPGEAWRMLRSARSWATAYGILAGLSALWFCIPVLVMLYKASRPAIHALIGGIWGTQNVLHGFGVQGGFGYYKEEVAPNGHVVIAVLAYLCGIIALTVAAAILILLSPLLTPLTFCADCKHLVTGK